MKIKNFRLLFALIIVFSVKLSAQDSTKKSIRISVLPSQFFFNDFPIIFEYAVGKFTFGVSPSLKFSTQNGGKAPEVVHGQFGDYTFQNIFNKFYNAFTISLNSKYYFNEKDKVYFESILFYRHWWFDRKKVSFDNVEGYSFNELRTEHQNVFGIKLVIGKTIMLWKNAKTYPIIDCYAGLGYRVRFFEFETLDNNFNIIGTYSGSYLWLVTPQFGIKLGFETMLKPKRN